MKESNLDVNESNLDVITKLKQKMDTDFYPRKVNDIVGVRQCTFSNDIIEARTYYFCPCTHEDFYPICEACAKSCHENHAPIPLLTDSFTCMCGSNTHKVENSANFEKLIKKKSTNRNECFFNMFQKVTLHGGYYRLNEEKKIVCSVCLEYCIGKTPQSEGISFYHPADEYVDCDCESHQKGNVINMNTDFSKPYFYKHFKTFNYNILDKIEITKEKYIDLLLKKIDNYHNSRFEEERSALSIEFFNNYFVFQIFQLFANLKEIQNPFFVLKKNFFDHKYYPTLMELFKNKDDLTKIKSKRDITTYCFSKTYFAQFLFNYFITRYLTNDINRINGISVCNLNIFQRFLYLHHSKNFWKNYTEKNESIDESLFEEYATAFCDQYEIMLHLDEVHSIDDFKEKIFLNFTKVFKELIKYNLISDEIRFRFFELLQDSLGNKKNSMEDRAKSKFAEHKEASYYIIKCIFYSLIYLNDNIILEEILKPEILDKSSNTKKIKYSFNCNKNSNLYCLIFCNIINQICRKNSNNDKRHNQKVLKFDFYVKKIFKLLVLSTKNNFYINSIENLKYISGRYKYFTAENTDYHQVVRDFFASTPILKDAMFNIVKISTSLNNICNDYFEYEILYTDFIYKANSIFNEFSIFLRGFLTHFPSAKKNFQHFNRNDFGDENNIKRIEAIQKAVCFTNYFNAFSKFLFIYGENKKFYLKTNGLIENENLLISNPNLEIMVIFLFICIINNYPNLNLLMTVNAERFLLPFAPIPLLISKFVINVSKMIFSDIYQDYKIDNFVFYMKLIIALCNIVNPVDDLNTPQTFLSQQFIGIGFICKVLTKTISFLNFDNDELFALVKLAKMKIVAFKKRPYSDYIFGYFNKDKYETYIEELKFSLKYFLKNYLRYINNIITSDVFFYGIFDEESMIFDLESYEEIGRNNIFPDIYVKQYFTENYVNLYFNFNVKNSIKQTSNMINLLYATYSKSCTEQKRKTQFTYTDRNLTLPHLIDSVTAEVKGSEGVVQNSETFFMKYLNILNDTKANSLKNLMEDFPNFILQCLSLNKEPEKTTKRVIRIFRYYYNLIVNPLFIIINHYLLYEMHLKAKESQIIHDLVLLFLQLTLNLYASRLEEGNSYTEFNFDNNKENLIKKNDEKKENSINNDQKNYLTSPFYELIFILDGITVNLNLTKSQIKELVDDIENLSNHVKYFEIDKIIEIFRKNLSMILIEITETKFNNVVVKRREIEKLLITNIDEDVEKQFIDKIDKIIKNYTTAFNLASERKSALVKVLSLNSSDTNLADVREELITYIQDKSCDMLNYINYENYDNSTLIGNFNIENNYVLFILKSLLICDLKGFQLTINNTIIRSPEFFKNLCLFMIRTSIFPSLIKQCKLMYELEAFPYRKYSYCFENTISFEITLNTLDLLIEFCQNHNQTTQQILYNIKVPYSEIPDPPKIEIQVEPIKTSIRPKINLIDELDLSQKKSIFDFAETLKRLSPKKLVKPDNFENSESKPVSVKKKKVDPETEKKIMELEKGKFCFINFLFIQMKFIIKHIPINEKELIYRNREFKNYDKFIELYLRLFNLVVQMIQGTNYSNFQFFFKKIPFMNIDEHYTENSEFYFFLKFSSNVRDIVYGENILDHTILPIKISIFSIFNNVITQDLQDDDSIILLSMSLFSMDELIVVASNYLRALYIKYVLNIDYNSDDFIDIYEELEFNDESLYELKMTFENNTNFFDDGFFTLSSQIYLFITILSEKYHYIKASTIKNLCNKEMTYDESTIPEALNKLKVAAKNKVAPVVNTLEDIKNDIKKQHSPENFTSKRAKRINNTKSKNSMNNLIITSKFFNEVICSCEFLIDSPNDDVKLDILKTVFFIVDPKTYLVSQASYEKFFNEVDRSSANSKLKGLIDQLSIFQTEINYKSDILKLDSLKKLFEIDYLKIDMLNFIISFCIIVILMIALQAGEQTVNYSVLYYTIYSLSAIQIIVDIVFLYIFYKSKYFYYVILNTSNIGKNKLSIIENLRLHILDCFLWNDETYFIVLNVLIASTTFFLRQATFLYTLQLFAVVKFVPTIKEIATAFRLRFFQFISMIAFLAILINFYAIFGFFFMMNEFNLTLGDNSTQNVCQTLLSCYMTYFNYGIRSGGGIGDLLNVKSMSEGAIYFIRYFADLVFYITVILLVLNMINGIIISTFSSIRAENEQRDEDINGKCFICSIPIVEFEKKKVNFKNHIEFEHNYITYIKYLNGLLLKNPRLIDADQSYILNCIQERKINIFPIGKSISLGNYDITEEESEEED